MDTFTEPFSHLPKYPPLGDVTTSLGMFRLTAKFVHDQIDNRLRYEYPDCVETIDCFARGLEAVCKDAPETIERQLLRIISMLTTAISTCQNTVECEATGNHELMKKVIVLIRDTPSLLVEQLKTRGTIPGVSMN